MAQISSNTHLICISDLSPEREDKVGGECSVSVYSLDCLLLWMAAWILPDGFSVATNTYNISNIGHSRYVDFAYLNTTTYVEVIFHFQHFFSIFLCISTLSMSKTVNMKQWVSRGDFSCLRYIFYYIYYCLCRSKNRSSHGHHIVCFSCVHLLAEVRTSSKHQ